MAAKTEDRFEQQLPKALTSTKEKDYWTFHRFVLTITTAKTLDACLDRYLALEPRYRAPASTSRSDMIFGRLLKQRIDASTRQDGYAMRLSAELVPPQSGVGPRLPIELRYVALPVSGRNEIQAAIRAKLTELNKTTTVLSLLDDAYRELRGVSPVGNAERWAFDPLIDPVLLGRYATVYGPCVSHWSTYVARPGDGDMGEVVKALEAFMDFLRDHRAQPRDLFQILRWTRLELAEVGPSYIQFEAYVQVVNTLLQYGAGVKHFEGNLRGFTPEERDFFFHPLQSTANPYRSDQAERFGNAIKNAAEFRATSVTCLKLVLMGRRLDAELVPRAEVLGVADKLAGLSSQAVVDRTFVIADTGTYPAAVTGRYRLGTKIGRTLQIVYFDPGRDSVPDDVYVEFDAVKGVLYRLRTAVLLGYVQDEPRKLVYADTKHLLKLIPMFFELAGYTFDLVDLGFVGLIKRVVVDRLVSEGLERVEAQMSVNGAGGAADAVMMLGSVLRRRPSAEEAVRTAESAFARQGERALEAEGKLLDRATGGALTGGESLGEEAKQRGLSAVNSAERGTAGSLERDAAADPALNPAGRAETWQSLEKHVLEEQRLTRPPNTGTYFAPASRKVSTIVKELKTLEKTTGKSLVKDLNEDVLKWDTKTLLKRNPQLLKLYDDWGAGVAKRIGESQRLLAAARAAGDKAAQNRVGKVLEELSTEAVEHQRFGAMKLGDRIVDIAEFDLANEVTMITDPTLAYRSMTHNLKTAVYAETFSALFNWKSYEGLDFRSLMASVPIEPAP